MAEEKDNLTIEILENVKNNYWFDKLSKMSCVKPYVRGMVGGFVGLFDNKLRIIGESESERKNAMNALCEAFYSLAASCSVQTIENLANDLQNLEEAKKIKKKR